MLDITELIANDAANFVLGCPDSYAITNDEDTINFLPSAVKCQRLCNAINTCLVFSSFSDYARKFGCKCKCMQEMLHRAALRIHADLLKYAIFLLDIHACINSCAMHD